MIIARRLSAVIAITLLSIPAGARSKAAQNTIHIQRGQVFVLQLLSPLHSNRNKKGDEFTCKVIEPAEYAEAIVTGRIASIEGAGKGGKKSKIALAFDSLSMQDLSGKFDAQVTEVYEVDAGNEGQADEEGVVKGKSKRKTAVKRGILGAIIGAGIGAAVGGAGGAVAGAAAGAAAGASSTLVMDGPELDFKSGTRFKVKTVGR